MRVKVPLKKGEKPRYEATILSVSGNSVQVEFVGDDGVFEYDFADVERIYDDDGLGGSDDEMDEEGETGDVNEEYDLGSEPSGDDSESDSNSNFVDTDDEDECILPKNKEKGIVKKLKGVISGGTKKMKDILPNIKKGSKKKSKPNGNGKDLCYSCASRSMCNANHLIACFFAVEHQKGAAKAKEKQNEAKTSKNQSTLKSWRSTKKNEDPSAATVSSSSSTTTSRNPTNGKVCIIFDSTVEIIQNHLFLSPFAYLHMQHSGPRC